MQDFRGMTFRPSKRLSGSRALGSAARELGLRHSSVSRRVAALEARVGAALFLRGTRLTPTKLARGMAARASTMRAAAAEIEAAVTAEQRHRAQRLVVTTNDVLAPLLFLVVSKTGSSPSVDVLVSDTELALAPGEVDLASSVGDPERRAARATPRDVAARGVPRADCASRLGPAEPSLRAKLSMRWWRHVPDDTNATITCNSLLGIRDARRAGFGRSVLPAFFAQDDPGLRLESANWMADPWWAPRTEHTEDERAQIRDARDKACMQCRGRSTLFHHRVWR